MNLRDGIPHSYADELPPARLPVERETPADFWRAFITFALLIVAIYTLALVGAAVAL
jgi:hypothetical protein